MAVHPNAFSKRELAIYPPDHWFTTDVSEGLTLKARRTITRRNDCDYFHNVIFLLYNNVRLSLLYDMYSSENEITRLIVSPMKKPTSGSIPNDCNAQYTPIQENAVTMDTTII